MQPSDEALVELCNNGSRRDAERAFSALYRRHRDFVIRVALRFTDDREIALDALQETFTYLLRRFPPAGDGLRLTARLTTLLYPVARNSAITLMRKSARFPQDAEPDDIAADEVPMGSDLDGLLKDLPPARREIVTMRFVDDMTLEEIADALAIPLGTVKSRLHLAVRTLRNSPDLKIFGDP